MARIIDGAKMNLIGENVAKFRKKLKMSQQKLSNMLELYAVYVCRGSILNCTQFTFAEARFRASRTVRGPSPISNFMPSQKP